MSSLLTKQETAVWTGSVKAWSQHVYNLETDKWYDTRGREYICRHRRVSFYPTDYQIPNNNAPTPVALIDLASKVDDFLAIYWETTIW